MLQVSSSPRRLLRAAFSAPNWTPLVLPVAASLLLLTAPTKPAHAQWQKTRTVWVMNATHVERATHDSYSTSNVNSVSATEASADCTASGTAPPITRENPNSLTMASATARGDFTNQFEWSGTGTPSILMIAVSGYVRATGVGYGPGATADDPYGGAIGSYTAYGPGSTISFPNAGTHAASQGNQTLVEIAFKMSANAEGRASGAGATFNSSANVVVRHDVQ